MKKKGERKRKIFRLLVGKEEMMKIVFMERDTLGNDVDLSRFSELGEVICYAKSDPLENAKRAADADILIVNKIPVNEELLKGARQLKLVCLTATGTNNVDFSYTNSRGIPVANVKGYSTDSVVQHTFAMLFYLYEKLAFYDRFVKSGEYARSDIFSRFDAPFFELCGKKWGIIGLGAIGRGVADVAKAFGCDVCYFSTSGKNVQPKYHPVSLDELLTTADIISIHAPLTPKTNGLIGKGQFAQMKDTAILLNLGRGPIVVEEDLANALKCGTIAGAGLDVLAVEPMAENNPLLQIKDSTKLLITPHIAWATVEARQRCSDEVFENIRAFLAGKERNIQRC